MSKILKIILSFFFILNFTLFTNSQARQNDNVFEAGISIVVPNSFFGVWRVQSSLIDTNSPSNFKKNNLDLWNISKDLDVINLSNPFSGASASIDIKSVNGNTIVFTKKGNYDNKILTDTVEITLNEDKFTGKNNLRLETLSDIDKSVIKTAEAEYQLKGEKIAGMNILGK